MWCKLFGCNLVEVYREQPIEVMQKIRYISYKECVRCKRKIDYSSYLQ